MKLDINNTKCMFCYRLLTPSPNKYYTLLKCLGGGHTNTIEISYYPQYESIIQYNVYEILIHFNKYDLELKNSCRDPGIFHSQIIYYNKYATSLYMGNIININDLLGPPCAINYKIYKYILYKNLEYTVEFNDL